MECGFIYCIYQQDYECLLPKIRISPLGLCDSCMVSAFPDIVLEEYKKRERETWVGALPKLQDLRD